MGIFTDFLAQAKSLDQTRPVEANRRVVWNDVNRLVLEFGDVDYPAGFAGRPALAILHVTGVLTADVPVTGTVEPLASALNRGNNARLPKEATIRMLALEAAIEDSNVQLECAILTAIKYGGPCNTQKPLPSPYNWTPCSLTVNDYVHRWSADLQPLSDGDDVTTMTDAGTAANDLIVAGGDAPEFKEGIFNASLPAARFVRTADGYLESSAPVTLYPSKRGTYVWLGILREAFSFGVKIMTTVQNNDDQLLFTRDDDVTSVVKTSNDLDGQVTLMTPPPNQLALDVPHLVIIMRDSDTTMRCRVNGVEEDGAVVSDYTPVSNSFRCGFVTGGGSSLAINHDLGIILSYDRVLSPGELTTLETELISCFGV